MFDISDDSVTNASTRHEHCRRLPCSKRGQGSDDQAYFDHILLRCLPFAVQAIAMLYRVILRGGLNQYPAIPARRNRG